MGPKETRIRDILYGMRSRCYNKNSSKYKNYGGRGINICDEWMNSVDSFIDWSLKNGYSDELTIDRIDVNKDYSPDNCRWADNYAQANNKTNSVNISYNGETKTMSEWALVLNMPYSTLNSRHQRGWKDKEIIEGKKGKRKSPKNKFIKYNNDYISLIELSSLIGVNIKTLYYRKSHGWTDEEIIEGKRRN